ncbi:MAG TPA: glycine cleavage system protein GcvH [Oceanithermus sp.]|nr:glycine cleavage system protein GcvH [Oceanithermus sp.]
MNVPEELKYRDTHEWVRVEDGVAVVGITDYAQGELGDVVYVELPEVGREVEAGEAVAVIESVKTASDIYAPVSGEIVEVNELLAEHPEKVNEDPYGEGWLFKIRMARPEELEALLDAEGYRKLLEAEG